LTGSAFRQPPEGAGGADAANVWQLGLVFARLLFGGELATKWEAVLQAPDLDDRSAEGREVIERVVREHFAIQELPGFKRLSEEHSDLRDIVVSMLAKSPDQRATSEQALGAVTDAAKQRGIDLPAPRQPSELAIEWRETSLS